MRVTRLTDLRLENSNQRIIMCPRCTQTTNQRCVLHNISFRHNITEMVLHRGCEEEMKNNNKDVPHRTALTYELLCPSFRPRPGTDAELQMSTNSTNNAWHPVRILNVSWVHYKTVRYTFSIRNRVPYRSSRSGPVTSPAPHHYTKSPLRVQFDDIFFTHIYMYT